MYSRSSPLKFMLMIQIVLLVILSTIINQTQAQTADTLTTLKRMKIVPELIHNPPSATAILKIGEKVVKPGDLLNAKDLKAQPTITWPDPNPEARSTIILLDLDRKKRSKNATIDSYNHLTIINSPGDSVVQGMAIVSYDSPGKTIGLCQGSKHRYLLMVYHQNEVIDLSKVIDYYAVSGYSEKREDFKLGTFAVNHGLTLKSLLPFYVTNSEGGLCSGSGSIYQISKWSTFTTMIASSLSMLLFVYCIRDPLN